MCPKDEPNTLEVTKTQETQQDTLHAEAHAQLTDHADMAQTMHGQQAQLAVQTAAAPSVLANMPHLPAHANAVGRQLAAPRKEGYLEKKKRRDLEKQFRKVRVTEQKLREAEGAAAITAAAGQTATAGYKSELAVLNRQLDFIKAQEDANLASVQLLIRQQKDGTAAIPTSPAASAEALMAEIKWDAQRKRYDAYHKVASAMEAGSKARVAAMKKAEEEKVKADVLRRKHKVTCMDAGAEREREDATVKRHEKYDMLKAIFRKPTVYSREDAQLTFTDENAQELRLVNTGRATMGGTKAMYEFDENGSQRQWLYKEATNCIGMAKPSGAVVTAEAYLLQRQLRGQLSIPAYCVRVDGEVVGSIQQKMQRAAGGVNLFEWQAQEDLTVNAPSAITMHDLMNEHTLDWVLCNFDTKGENFINQAGGHVISFDKEASFNKLLDAGSRVMSYTYKPHSNDTIYNTMFRAYAEGKLDLDLYANEASIQSIEAQDPQHYAEMFRGTLDAKYKKGSKDRREAEALLIDRFQTLRETYRTFYTSLIQERLTHFQEDSEAHQQERQRLNAYLRDGVFRFRDE